MRPLPRSRFTTVAIAAAITGLVPRAAHAKSPILELPRAERVDLARARELDALGARAYRDGRAREALLLFTEAYRAGGPSVELWNVARCHQRLDEPDDAAAVLERYLGADDLSSADRAEATRELADLRRRSSLLVVDASQSGADVAIDGKRVGVAPLAESVGPGRHLVRLDQGGRVTERTVEAAAGRTVVVRGEAAEAGTPTPADPAAAARARVELDLQGGVYAHVLGAVAGRVGAGGTLGAKLALARGDLAPFVFARAELFELGWSTSAPERPIVGCILPDRYQATALGASGGAGLAWDVARTVRTAIELGAGAETLSLAKGGGDVLTPSCDPSPGVVPTFGARASVSFATFPGGRAVLTPLAFAMHPAYDDARQTPRDATGVWIRVGANLGITYDLGL